VNSYIFSFKKSRARYRNFNRFIVWGLLFSLLCIGLLNLIIDPFAVFEFYNDPKLNLQKPALISDIRSYHLHQLRTKKPSVIILGSSRAQIGLNAKHPKLIENAVNLGMPLATMDEIRDYLFFAQKQQPLRQVIVAIDFFGFNAYLKSQSPFLKSPSVQLSLQEKVPQLFGWTAFLASIQTLKHNLFRLEENSTLPTRQFKGIAAKTIFEKSERFYLEHKIYKPQPYKLYDFVHKDTKESRLNAFEEICQFCQTNYMDCKILILPVHTRQLALISALGLWSKFEDWKRQCVAITNAFSNIALYDFTGFSDFHNERIPAIGAPQQNLQWFVDSAHITTLFGDLILDVVLSNQNSSPFGKKIDRTNIESHLLSMREQQQHYAHQQDESYQEVLRLVHYGYNAV